MHERTERARLILAAVSDLVSDFLYDDRVEDEALPRGQIEAAIAAGEITPQDIIDAFEAGILDNLKVL